MDAKVKVNIEGLKRFAKDVERGLKTGAKPIGDAFRQWAVRYRSAMQERFDAFSKGGGDWAPLKPATIAARRHGKGGKYKRGKKALGAAIATGGGQVSILRDTGVLFNTLSPEFIGAPGQHQKTIPYGIEVGFGGSAKHPKGGVTIADIASYHQEGKGPLPKREILVDPPPRVVEKMADDMERALLRLIKENQVKSG